MQSAVPRWGLQGVWYVEYHRTVGEITFPPLRSCTSACPTLESQNNFLKEEDYLLSYTCSWEVLT